MKKNGFFEILFEEWLEIALCFVKELAKSTMRIFPPTFFFTCWWKYISFPWVAKSLHGYDFRIFPWFSRFIRASAPAAILNPLTYTLQLTNLISFFLLLHFWWKIFRPFNGKIYSTYSFLHQYKSILSAKSYSSMNLFLNYCKDNFLFWPKFRKYLKNQNTLFWESFLFGKIIQHSILS